MRVGPTFGHVRLAVFADIGANQREIAGMARPHPVVHLAAELAERRLVWTATEKAASADPELEPGVATSAEIARAESISPKYLEGILAQLLATAASARSSVHGSARSATQRTPSSRCSRRARGKVGPASLTCESLVLRVSDEGPGISAEEQARLFLRFERGAAARSHGARVMAAILTF